MEPGPYWQIFSPAENSIMLLLSFVRGSEAVRNWNQTELDRLDVSDFPQIERYAETVKSAICEVVVKNTKILVEFRKIKPARKRKEFKETYLTKAPRQAQCCRKIPVWRKRNNKSCSRKLKHENVACVVTRIQQHTLRAHWNPQHAKNTGV